MRHWPLVAPLTNAVTHPIFRRYTEPMQYRAIGLFRDQYFRTTPSSPTAVVYPQRRGTEESDSRCTWSWCLSLVRRHLDMATPSLVVYPRLRETDNLHLQIVGVLGAEHPRLPHKPAEPCGEAESSQQRDDFPRRRYFSVPASLILHPPEVARWYQESARSPAPDGSRGQPFKLQLKGEIPWSTCVTSFPLTYRAVRAAICANGAL